MTTAAATAPTTATPKARRGGLITPNNTRQTLTSGQLGGAQSKDTPPRRRIYDSL
jgi:hypothetical protein